jgi:hypothetical protein
MLGFVGFGFGDGPLDPISHESLGLEGRLPLGARKNQCRFNVHRFNEAAMYLHILISIAPITLTRVLNAVCAMG